MEIAKGVFILILGMTVLCNLFMLPDSFRNISKHGDFDPIGALGLALFLSFLATPVIRFLIVDHDPFYSTYTLMTIFIYIIFINYAGSQTKK